MKLIEIPDRAILELHFKFQQSEYSMNVMLQLKSNDAILIQAIRCNGQPLEDAKIKDATLTYKVDGGFYTFQNLNMKLLQYQGVYIYSVTSDYISEKQNRREAYRIFAGESLSLKLIKRDGVITEQAGTLKDISLTGMGVILPIQIENLMCIKAVLTITDNVSVPMLGEVVRVTELPNNKGYLYGCKFNEPNNLLSRYVLKCQVKKKSESIE